MEYDSVVVFLHVARAYIAKFFLTSHQWGRTRYRKTRITPSFQVLGSSCFRGFQSLRIAFRTYGYETSIACSLAARECQRFFFKLDFLGNSQSYLRKFLQGRVPPRSALLKFRGTWGRGSNLGARPPKVKFYIFFCGTSPGAESVIWKSQ